MSNFEFLSSKVYFNGTVYHAEESQQYADNVNVFWMIPPYVKYTKLDHDPDLTYQETKQGPKFSVSRQNNLEECCLKIRECCVFRTSHVRKKSVLFLPF